VRRKLSSATTYENIGDVTANTTSFIDNNAVSGVTYVYMVRPLVDGVSVKNSNTPSITNCGTGSKVASTEEMSNVVLIQPNPFENEFVFELTSEIESVQAELFDMSGKSKAIQVTRLSDYQYKLNTQGLSSGWYMLKVATNEGVKNVRVLKQ
jgi:hypothetical protein